MLCRHFTADGRFPKTDHHGTGGKRTLPTPGLAGRLSFLHNGGQSVRERRRTSGESPQSVRERPWTVRSAAKVSGRGLSPLGRAFYVSGRRASRVGKSAGVLVRPPSPLVRSPSPVLWSFSRHRSRARGTGRLRTFAPCFRPARAGVAQPGPSAPGTGAERFPSPEGPTDPFLSGLA